MLIVTVIGAICSAVGAIVSIRFAHKTRKIRDEVVHDRRKKMLVDAVGMAKRARAECRKIMTPVTPESNRGVDQVQVVGAVRDCLEKLRDNRHLLPTPELTSLISKASSLLAKYSKESGITEMGKTGDSIYDIIGSIIEHLSREMDEET